MATHADAVSLRLSRGLTSARELAQQLGISQPSVSRAVASLGDQVVRVGAARSIQYALRDTARGLPDMPVYRVDAHGKIHPLGTLVPVRPAGFVMRQTDGVSLHSDGLPWWLFDMRPQGYLGRAYAARHAAALGLPPRLGDWSDADALRALLAQGHDLPGNLLLGDVARDHFLAAPPAQPVAHDDKAAAYARLAREAAQGDLPGSSAGGEQPKFTTFATTPHGLRHVLVKFSEREPSPVSERWRDLLLAEHLALDVLREAPLPGFPGVAAATTQVVDSAEQRFLEVQRFDRIGSLGRCALFSLAALDAEFAGIGTGGWPPIVRQLAADGHINAQAAHAANLLWAYGTLIGNTDMHAGNLSFISERGRPYGIAPAYDMSPMAFAPRSSGSLPDAVPEAIIHAAVDNTTWRQAGQLAHRFLARLKADARFSQRFAPCVAALGHHIDTASSKIGRLG